MATLKQDHFNIGSKFVFHMLLNGLQLHSSSPLIVAVSDGGAVYCSVCSFGSILVFVLLLSGPRNNCIVVCEHTNVWGRD